VPHHVAAAVGRRAEVLRATLPVDPRRAALAIVAPDHAAAYEPSFMMPFTALVGAPPPPPSPPSRLLRGFQQHFLRGWGLLRDCAASFSPEQGDSVIVSFSKRLEWCTTVNVCNVRQTAGADVGLVTHQALQEGGLTVAALVGNGLLALALRSLASPDASTRCARSLKASGNGQGKQSAERSPPKVPKMASWLSVPTQNLFSF